MKEMRELRDDVATSIGMMNSLMKRYQILP